MTGIWIFLSLTGRMKTMSCTVNNRNGTCTDVSSSNGIFELSRGKTYWGTELFDYDNDGYLDFYIT